MSLTYTAYLLLGLATSLHCIGMCGGLVLTYSVKHDGHGGFFRRLAPHLAYQGSKMLSYMVVALLLGSVAAALGGAFDLTTARNWIMLVAGVYMVLLGLGMTGYFPWLGHLSPRPPKFLTKLLSANRKRALADSKHGEVHYATPVTFGLLTGLLPCAPLITAQVGAISSGSPLTGALLMAAFALGTAPLMIVFGLASSFASGAMRQRMQYVAAVAVVIFGLVIFNRGLMLVGSPVTFDTVRRAVAGDAPKAGQKWRVVDGVAVYDLVIRDVEFVPSVVRVPADRPVRLVVDRQEDNACSDQIAIPRMGVLVNLAPNAKTTVNLPATAAGSYTLTCGMGMMAGRIIFGGGGTGPTIWMWVLGLGAIAAMGVIWVRAVRRHRVTQAGGGGNGKRPRSSDKTSPGVFFGFTAVETALLIGGVTTAIVAGLVLGGVLGR